MMKRSGELWIFDMDGTLFRSETVAVSAFRAALAKMEKTGMKVPMDISDRDITCTFGHTHERIWHMLLGSSLSIEQQEKADAWLLEAELELLKAGAGALFEGVYDTLLTLRLDGAALCVASNGQQAYIEAIAATLGLSTMFAKMYSAAGFQTASKVDLVRLVLSEMGHDKAVMVGDRSSDVEAGQENGLLTVGCAFGFADQAELVGADVVVTGFADILSVSL